MCGVRTAVLGCVLAWLIGTSSGSLDSGETSPVATVCDSHPLRQLYVSTIDGGLTALNEHGHTLWTYRASHPLFYSSLNHVQDREHIIPSLDRGIYRWNGMKLTQLPFSADDLIDHTHILDGHQSILAGAKANDVVGVNIHTGKPIYECTHERCHRYDNQSLIQRMDVLKLTTSRVTVREANDLTGEEMWNFTVGDMELMLIEGDVVGEEQSCNQFEDLDWELHVDTLQGVLYCTAKSDKRRRLWEVSLGVPVVKAWLQDGGKLESVSLSHGDLAVVHPRLMMVHYNSQYYLQRVEGYAHLGEVQQVLAEGHQLVESPQISSQVYLRQFSLKQLDAGGSDHTSLVVYNSDTFQELCTVGPKGVAVYFYDDPLPYENFIPVDNKSEKSHENVCSMPPNPVLSEVSWLSWLTHKLFSVFKYLLFGAFVLLCNKLRRYVRVHRQRFNSGSSTTNDIANDDEFPLLDQLVNTIRRHSSLTDSVATPTSQHPSTPGSSTETLVSPLSRSDSLPEPRVLPRFGSDYELKGRLGKGGFGVVYHVQNKTDGGEYAVKRIKLPGKRAARDKVMREVRALAQLDHARIVRYFNSWVEKAPVGWSEMEEWMPISRRPSFIQDSISTSPAHVTHSSLPGPAPKLVPAPLSRLGNPTVNKISPCPSFNSLNHSTIHSVVPPLTTDSRSSSFVIEFKDESGRVSSAEAHDQTTPLEQASLDLTDMATFSGDGSATDESTPSGCGQEHLLLSSEQDGCFSRALLRDRDELSSAGSETQSTEDKDEQRDCVSDLAAEPPTYLFIQMQLCKKESLKDWLKSNVTNRNHGKVMHFFDQILDAVMYVHSKGMMHRDLKPSNIFFSLEGNIKIGDFGLVTSSTYGGLHSSYLTLKTLGEEQHRQQHTGNLGSHFYMSPELISGRKYDYKVDIFSLGVIFFELHYPFHTEMERAKVLEDVRQYKFPSNFESSLPVQAELVKWLMAYHPNDRPLVKDIYDSAKFNQLAENVMETIPKL